MDCHQILSGACNAGDRCFAIGSVEGIPFTAYAAGCNIVILASTFERVQIIPGATHNYIRISALDCSTDTGKIAAAYEDKVCIFEPTPLIHSDTPPSHGLEYRWVQTGTIHTKSHISSLSWNLEGTRLLTGGVTIQMWHGRITHKEDDEPTGKKLTVLIGVKFEIGGDRDPKTPTNEEDTETWDCVWKCHTATPVHHMAFSPDGTLFATSGKSDRLIKVWYENKQLLFPNKSMDNTQYSSMNSTDHNHPNMELSYGFVYIAHPRAVTHISWRKTSKYMPKGSVSNMLVTSCLDNICRIWIETVLPDDGLVNMNQFDPLATQNPKFRTHRQKHRFMQRLKHMKTCFHIRRHAKHHAGAAGMHGLGAAFGGPGAGTNFGHSPIPSLPSTYSVHDFHSYGYHGTGVTPGLHFHLAASINAETDIPLVPSMQTNDPSNQPNFILHWLNNKEMHFSLQAEAILQDLTRKVIEKEHLQNLLSSGGGGGGVIGSDHASETGHEVNEDNIIGSENDKKTIKLNKSMKNSSSHEDSNSDDHMAQYSNKSVGGIGGMSGSQQTMTNHHSMSNTTSINSLATEHGVTGTGTNIGGPGGAGTGGNGYHIADSLDMKIECLLRDWHHSPDLLFSIHPIDGSYLIWVVEWLDEYHPGAFRQAQVSFSTRIPSGFPLGDAMSMSTTVSLYNTGGNLLHFKEMVKGVKPSNVNSNGTGPAGGDPNDILTPLPSVIEESENEWPTQPENNEGGNINNNNNNENLTNQQTNENNNNNNAANSINESLSTKNASDQISTSDLLSAPPSPTISMVTKHSNGTLNLWQLTFADKTKFTQVLSIGHVSRASGHRFRVNDITCHPVLPLLLTTSHHNIPEIPTASAPVPGRLNSNLNVNANINNSHNTNSIDRRNRGKDICVPSGFCSELILWRVDAVGPLSQSGGVSELARINSLEISAFSNVAWIPTLLPSTTLGSLSNSSSACFVASDGESLRIYQAVIDARTLLAEISSSERRARRMDSMLSLSTEYSSDTDYHHNQHQSPLHNKIKIVSQQSTARPGCIIQLDAITDATHDWQNTQFLHVFQEQLITGERIEIKPQIIFTGDISGSMGPGTNGIDNVTGINGDIGLTEQQMGAIVDLQRNADFEEPFYIALLERTSNGSTMHMWRIVIASQPPDLLSESVMYVPDSNIVQDLDDPEPGPRHSVAGLHSTTSNNTLFDAQQQQQQQENDVPHIRITTTKVCTQELPLPDGVDVVHAAPAAGHLSSSSIYPACFAPYIIVTACSDSTSRFWKCKIIKSADDPDNQQLYRYEWCEWDMLSKDYVSNIEINGQPLHISAAYSGRIACAYKYGKSFTRPNNKGGDPDSRYVNLSVAIYECESTGGSEWILEDTIHLKNVHLPRLHLDPHLDLSYLHDNRYLQKKQRLTQVLQTFTTQHDENRSRNGVGGSTGAGSGIGGSTGGGGVGVNGGHVSGDVTPDGLTKTSNLLAVPSFSTLQSLRKSITDHGNTCPLTQKHLVQLDWVSKEDGSHILTVAVGSKILLYTPVSSDLAQANIKAMKESQSTNRPILRKASSLAQPHFNDEIRWMKLRQIELNTADGLPPLPMQMSWVRDGILVVGMDSEMHVYSQWKSNRKNISNNNVDIDDLYDTRNLRDEDLRSMANENSQRRLANVTSMPHLSRVSSMNLQMLEKKKKAAAAAAAAASSSSSSGTGLIGATTTTGGTTNISATGGGTFAVTVTTDYMPDYGLFEASRIACPVLPQYHPKQLMELLNSGKIRWVKAILAHLVRCISATYGRGISGGVGGGGNSGSGGGDEESLNRQRGWSRSRTLSVSYVAGTTSPLEPRGSTTQMPEELTLDYAEITSIPPLPLWTLLDADKEMSGGAAQQQTDEAREYVDLFDANVTDENDDDLDELLDGDDTDTHQRFDRRQSVPERQSLSHFGPRQGQLLSRLLTHTHLPGLSSLDQMHLLALADTVATCNIDFAERFANDAARTAMAKENLTGVPDAEAMSTDSLDDCGLRFLLAMKHFTYLLRCLPLAQRTQFQKQGVGTSNIVWAFHSESEEDILNLIPSYGKGQIKWQTIKELGAGWWLRNNGLLRLCIEKLAKAAYQAKQDPMDAAIYYIAMKKKSLVWGLYRTKRDEKMTAFFANDFSDDRWRKAALKNAFALLGKQRFEHAVAFFLLANSLNDAIEVCLTKLEDLQLALIIARLFESDHDATPPTYKKLLNENILGCDSDGDNQCLENAHPDPFLRSMALWILKDYSGSLNTLLLNNVGHNHPDYVVTDPLLKSVSNQATNPNVFNFYIYLRTHPLLIRQYIASTAQEKKKTQVVLSGFSYSGVDGPPISINSKKGRTDKQIQIEDSITPLERQLYFTTAHGHFKAGCPALALEVLSKLPTKVIEESTSQLVSPNDGKHNQQIVSGILDWNDNSKIMNGLDTNDNTNNNNGINGITNDWSAPVSNSFDWSQPVTKNNDDDGFKIEWDDDKNDDDDDDDDIGIGMNIDKKKNVDNVETVSPIQVDMNINTQRTEALDIMAQQLKFVACLKILMEELSTLATGFEVDGGQLRYQLYVWLEKEVEALRQLCNYSSADPDSSMDDSNVHDTIQNDTTIPTNFKSFEKPTLHEILMQEKFDFEAKVQRAARRKRWLKANETLLRTLLSYCSLHGASGGGLASVRMELVLLLQELQQEKTQQQLLSPLPFPTTLPLLSACVAGNKTVTADPIKYLQSHTQDMLQTIVDLRQPPIGLKVSSASEIFVLRDLAVALSACIYQSLCDSDTFIVKQVSDLSGFQSPGMETLARLNASCQSSHLMANAGAHQRRRKYSSDEPVTVSTSPSKWPGVTNLRALLAREKDEDIPRLNVLLCEAFMATFMSLLVYALATCDCHILYRLAGQKFSSVSWSNLFGGGIKKLLRKATSQLQTMSQPQTSQSNDNYQIDTPESPMTATPASATDTNKVWTAVTSLTKQRVKLNMKLLGHFSNPTGSPNMKEDKPTYREQFVSPDMSMVSYFLIKPTVYNHDPDGDEYDSADSISSDIDDDNDEEDVFADPLNNDPKINQASAALKKHRMENTEHSNPNSYSWVIMRLAVMRIAQLQLQEFIGVAGIEHQELPVASPLIHGVIRALTLWQDIVKEELSIRGPAPPDFIPGCFVESDAKGPAIHKYRSILEKHNTPFSPIKGSAAPAIRLWNYLVRQDAAQEIFIRAIFGKKRSPTITNATIETSSIAPSISGGGGIGGGSSLGDILTPSGGGGGVGVGGIGTSDGYSQSNQNINLPEPVRIIHKEQESISAFCLNLVNPGLLALATPREAQEMDIALLLESPHWLEDECELDILNLNKDIDTLPASGFLLIQATPDKNTMHQSSHTAQSYTLPASTQQGIAGQSGRGASVVLKHKVDNIKRMCAHPLMPLYLTGGQDGSVQLWEWGHQQVVCTPRPPGTFAKVTRCRFSQHGNKFGIADGDGNLSLWQAGLATQCNRSFFTFQCHNKGITDFVFLGSCSLVASAGHSSENKNVCIWDTLLPQKKSLVVAFTCHDQGASSLVYAPQHQLLISAGKKGDICIFDVRQRKLRHRFQAHENPIKCLAIDPHEEHFVTGSADGDIKVWGLTVHTSLYSFPGEHARNSFFKHIGQGVTQLQVDANGRLFSCGADGSMKVRQLPDRESIIHSFY